MYIQSFHLLAWVIRIITLWFQKSFIFSSSWWSWERRGENRRVNYSVFWRALVPALCGCFAARVPRVHVGVETPYTGFDWVNEWVNNSKEECLTSVVFSAPNVCLTVSKISLVNIWLWAVVRLPFYVLKGSPLRFLLTHHTHTHTHTHTHPQKHTFTLPYPQSEYSQNTQNTRTHISLFIMVMTSHLLFTRYIPMFSPLCHCSLMMWLYFWMNRLAKNENLLNIYSASVHPRYKWVNEAIQDVNEMFLRGKRFGEI